MHNPYLARLVSLATKSSKSLESIPAVSPDEFSKKIAQFCYDGYLLIQAVIIPVALVVMAISVLFFICGRFIKSSTGQKIGLGGVFVSLGGLFFFWGLPMLIGVAKGLSTHLK